MCTAKPQPGKAASGRVQHEHPTGTTLHDKHTTGIKIGTLTSIRVFKPGVTWQMRALLKYG
jgi:hypothetical protein